MPTKKYNKKKKQKNQASKKPVIPVFFKQILSAIFLIFISYQIVDSSKSYTWVINLLSGNLETISKYPNLTTEEKQKAKIPGESAIMNFYKKNTPENAIILMPPPNVISETKELRNLSSANLNSKGYATYFVYPRKLVYPSDIEQNPSLKDSVTHIAIMNYSGYESLSYKVSKKQKFAILPVKTPVQ